MAFDAGLCFPLALAEIEHPLSIGTHLRLLPLEKDLRPLGAMVVPVVP